MLKKWQVVIVEDEYWARENLKLMLTTRYDDIEIVGEAETAKEALRLFQELKTIDGVFVDIVLETESERAGLDLAANLSKRENPPWLIFTTAYEKHALEAIKTHPIDYLLKPLDASKLDAALDYVRKVCSNKPLSCTTSETETRIEVAHTVVDKYGCKERCKCFIKPSEIVYVRKNSNSSSIQIKLLNGDTLDNIAGTLADWQKKLQHRCLLQIHRSYFVNLKQAYSIHPHPFQKETYQLIFKCCAERLTIGETFYQQLVEKLQSGANE
jgi:DNA-binding LytR/AlgR family response regulator